MVKKVVIILVDEFEDIELISFKEVLENVGFEIEVIGDIVNYEVVGKYGEKVIVDVSIVDVKLENYDVLLIFGGFLFDYLCGDEEGCYGIFVKYFIKNDVLIFVICYGLLVLVDIDDLKGCIIMGVINVCKDLLNVGVNVVDELVVVDNNIVISCVFDDLDDFNREIVKKLEV